MTFSAKSAYPQPPGPTDNHTSTKDSSQWEVFLLNNVHFRNAYLKSYLQSKLKIREIFASAKSIGNSTWQNFEKMSKLSDWCGTLTKMCFVKIWTFLVLKALTTCSISHYLCPSYHLWVVFMYLFSDASPTCYVVLTYKWRLRYATTGLCATSVVTMTQVQRRWVHVTLQTLYSIQSSCHMICLQH